MPSIRASTRLECYAATRPQQCRTQNEDSFLIKSGDRPFAALADGAGNAERAAKRVLSSFEKLLNEALSAQIGDAETWAKWVKLLDSSLPGGAQSTFLAVAFIGSEAVGACVGDSRLYPRRKVEGKNDGSLMQDGARREI